MAYFQKQAYTAAKAGNNQTTVSHVGILQEDGTNVLVRKGEFGFSTGFKLGQPYQGKDITTTYVNFPYFKISSNPETKNNYLNLLSFKLDNVIQVNEENVESAIKNYTETFITYMTDLLSVFCNKEEGRSQRDVARYKVLGFSRIAKAVNSKFETTPFYTFYGNTESGEWKGDNTEPNTSVGRTGNTLYYGLLNDKPMYLTAIPYTDGVVYFYEKDFSEASAHLEGEEKSEFQLELLSEAVTIWMENLLEFCLEYVKDNNRGQKGHVFKAWTKTKKGDWYLTPVTTLKSLVVSRGSLKVNNDWVQVTPENQEEFPEFKKYYYGSMTGLAYKEMSYKKDGEYTSRLQFMFRNEPFNEGIEGVDDLVTYRGGF